MSTAASRKYSKPKTPGGFAPSGAQRRGERLLSDYRPLVCACARRYAGRGAEMEDLIQEGFAALLELAPQCPDPQWMACWLKRRLPGRVRDAAARLWRHSGAANLDELVETGREAGTDSQGNVQELEVSDLLERSLGPQDAQIVRWLMQGCSQKEIAEKSAVSQQAISGRIRRIRKRLAPALQRTQ